MVARFAGAGLGLFAFAVTMLAGLFIHNPVDVILSRSIFALFVFCIIGLLLGSAAQKVVGEHEKKRVSELKERFRPSPTVTEDGSGEDDGEIETVYTDSA